MSLVSKTNRRLSSPENIKIPAKFNNDFEVMIFFGEIIRTMFDMFKILKSSENVTELNNDYTTVGSETLIAANTITITLNINPNDQEKVKIKNINGITTIKSDKKIDGFNKLYITEKYDAPTLIYLSNKDQWFII
jgi:hypothetical protein